LLPLFAYILEDGFFFWVPEVLFCDSLQSLNFHSWWHVTSTFGCFVLVLFAIFQREMHRGRNPQLNYNNFLGVPILPYVHIPSPKEQLAINIKKLEEEELRKQQQNVDANNESTKGKKKSYHKKSSVSTFFQR